MHIDHFALVLSNIVFLSLTAIVTTSGSMPPLQEKLQRLWKFLTTPILPLKKPAGRKPNRFWEIDMTKFEP